MYIIFGFAQILISFFEFAVNFYYYIFTVHQSTKVTENNKLKTQKVLSFNKID